MSHHPDTELKQGEPKWSWNSAERNIKSEYEIKRERIALHKKTYYKAVIAQYNLQELRAEKGHIFDKCRSPKLQVMHVTAEEYESFVAENDCQRMIILSDELMILDVLNMLLRTNS
jgi:hypothetical protein